MRIRRLGKKGIIILTAVAVLAAAGIFFWNRYESGIVRFNHYSVLDFALGEHIEGIDSEADARAYNEGRFEYFSDEYGSGIKPVASDERYYLGERLGKYCVVRFASTESRCSVMSINVGVSELDAKTLLLDGGYRIKGAGYNSCRALDGNVYIELKFLRGEVTEISAYFR